ncbi:helix-turn-helix transcriptional regulator [Acidovorax lacteus]|uniref:AlpA family phage regulatory protein n=1 Tax=Acidovorax lacteus TaxID=1924988 RepID=A0ABP8KWX5_9BURK
MTKPTQATNALAPETHSPLPKVSNARLETAIPSFDDLPDSALARQSQLVRDPKYPARPTPLPFSPATFWRKVKDGTFPQPVKLGARITAWRVGDVRRWIAAQGAE